MLTALEQGFWPVVAVMGKSAVVLVAAMVAAACCRGSAALRHAVRSAGILAALLLPLATLVIPGWEWRILPPSRQVENSISAAEPLASRPESQPLPTARQRSEPARGSLSSGLAASPAMTSQTDSSNHTASK